MLDNTFSADYFLHNSFTVGNLLKKVNIMKKDRGGGVWGKASQYLGAKVGRQRVNVNCRLPG